MVKLSLVICAMGFIGYKTYINPLEKQEIVINEDAILSADSTKSQITLGDSIVDYSMTFLGFPYVTAGNGVEGFDCSGFVYYVLRHFSIPVPRSSIDYKNFGQEIPIENVEKGDVLVFLSPTRNEIGHVGIVSKPAGMESEFIHATSGGQKAVVLTQLNSPYYSKRFIKAVRVLHLKEGS